MKNKIIITSIFATIGALCFIFGDGNSFAHTAGFFWFAGAVAAWFFAG